MLFSREAYSIGFLMDVARQAISDDALRPLVTTDSRPECALGPRLRHFAV